MIRKFWKVNTPGQGHEWIYRPTKLFVITLRTKIFFIRETQEEEKRQYQSLSRSTPWLHEFGAFVAYPKSLRNNFPRQHYNNQSEVELRHCNYKQESTGDKLSLPFKGCNTGCDLFSQFIDMIVPGKIFIDDNSQKFTCINLVNESSIN